MPVAVPWQLDQGSRVGIKCLDFHCVSRGAQHSGRLICETRRQGVCEVLAESMDRHASGTDVGSVGYESRRILSDILLILLHAEVWIHSRLATAGQLQHRNRGP